MDAFVAKCPGGLDTFCVHGCDSEFRLAYLDRGGALCLADKLHLLTSVELSNCMVALPAECMMFFQRLAQLSLAGSHVVSPSDISLLTNLTLLDLSHCRWRTPGPGGSDPSLKSFQARPALLFLKLTGCSLIDNSTMLDVASVSELHTHVLPASMEQAKVHYSETVSPSANAFYLSSCGAVLWSMFLVELQLTVLPESLTASLLDQLLQSFSLHILSQAVGMLAPDSKMPCRPSQFVGSQKSSLRDFRLSGFCCWHIDLSLSHLTHVSLCHVDVPGRPCSIQLPTTLESLDFCGHSLFSRRSEMCFQHLKVLSEVSLSFPRTSKAGSNNPSMVLDDESMLVPIFPRSLRSLSILCCTVSWLLDRHAQNCLSPCTNLQHLPHVCDITDCPQVMHQGSSSCTCL